MPKAHNPRQGSMQFWPRKRSKHSLARVRSWAQENKIKPLGFIGYKAGMAQVLFNDTRAKSLTKGEKVSVPVTIIECPPITVSGVSFYKKSLFGLKKINSLLADKNAKELARKIQLPKKALKSLDDVKEFDDLRLLISSNPQLTGIGTKKPKLIEIALGGSKEDKLNYVKNVLGKNISITEVFEAGILVDAHGITKGKGFQGTVKRFGVPIRQHKAEKTKRGIGNLGSWTPKRVQFTVPQAGKMGFHSRTEYNKQILKISENDTGINPEGGLNRYGIIKNNYLLLKGSIAGPKKSTVLLTLSRRPNVKISKEPAPEIISLTI